MAYCGWATGRIRRARSRRCCERRSPRAILVSGGGNDIAGDEFGLLLNHAASGVARLNEDIVSGVIDQRLFDAYVTILNAITAICESQVGAPVPIVVHGYDYAVPDGRGFAGGWWFLPGPWLEPGFRKKGYPAAGRAALVRVLIDRFFNRMLRGVAQLPHFPHVQVPGPSRARWRRAPPTKTGGPTSCIPPGRGSRR